MQIEIKYRIQEIRRQRRISLRQLEYMSGVSKSQIGAIENNQCDPTITTLCMIAEALGINIAELFSYTRL